MHKLVRTIHFLIEPCLYKDKETAERDDLASQQQEQMLALYFELSVGIVGQVNDSTGFVVNVLDIDQRVHEKVEPIFSQIIGQTLSAEKHMGITQFGQLLKLSSEKIKDEFKPAVLAELSLNITPFKKLALDCEDLKMLYFSETFDFAATHKLWNDEFSEQQNFEVFGKCANPSGHGHNYTIEVTVKMFAEQKKVRTSDINNVVENDFLKLVDHKNLNVDVPQFEKDNPTVENIAAFAWDKLKEKFENAKLHCITISETNKTHCSYYG